MVRSSVDFIYRSCSHPYWSHWAGSDELAEAALNASMRLDELGKKAQVRKKSDGELVGEDSEVEEEIDQALEALLDAEMAADGVGSHEDSGEEHEEEEEEEEDVSVAGDGAAQSLHNQNNEEESTAGSPPQLGGKRKRAYSTTSLSSRSVSKIERDCSFEIASKEKHKRTSQPPNFSQVDTSQAKEELFERFPLFKR